MHPGEGRQQQAQPDRRSRPPPPSEQDEAQRHRQRQRAEGLRVELVEVEEQRRHEPEEAGHRGGQARPPGGLAGQEEDRRDQRRGHRVPEQERDGQSPFDPPDPVQGSIHTQRGHQQERGSRRQDVIDSALFPTHGLPRHACGADGRGAHGAVASAQHRRLHPGRLACDGHDRIACGRQHGARLEPLHRPRHALDVQREAVAQRHGHAQGLGLVAGMAVPVPRPRRRQQRVREE